MRAGENEDADNWGRADAGNGQRGGAEPSE